MQNLKILNNKEVKKIMNELKEQYGTTEKLDFAFFENFKSKVYILSKKFGELNDKNLRINNLGMYFGKKEKGGFRLSIEGAQMIKAKKNVLEIDDREVLEWISRNDLKTSEKMNGFIIIRNKNDVYGVGKIKEGKVMNFVSKDRRVIRPQES